MREHVQQAEAQVNPPSPWMSRLRDGLAVDPFDGALFFLGVEDAPLPLRRSKASNFGHREQDSCANDFHAQ